jgi:hypothetical protein
LNPSTNLDTTRTDLQESDFSDTEYQPELEEERVALKCVQQLQEWAKTDNRASKLNLDL